LAELRQMRSDAAEAKATQQRANESAIRAFCDGVLRLQHRVDTFITKRNAELRAEAEAAAAREKRKIQDKLDRLPDADNPTSWHPSGDLEGVLKEMQDDNLQCPIPASHDQDKEQLRAITEGDADNQGDLPEDLLRSVPADPGDFFNATPVDCK
jgi:hypothetical protein